MRELPALSEMMDDTFEISHEVKIWRFGKDDKPVPVQFPANEDFKDKNGLYMKKGPFFEMWKHEVKKLSTSIINRVQQEIDWNKPEEVIEVLPKWLPAVQVVKFSGK
jgi:hypothetical protein